MAGGANPAATQAAANPYQQAAGAQQGGPERAEQRAEYTDGHGDEARRS